MSQFVDLSGTIVGIWKVLKFDHMEYHGTNHAHGMSYYLCRCAICGQEKIIARSNLTQFQGIYHKACGGEK